MKLLLLPGNHRYEALDELAQLVSGFVRKSPAVQGVAA